MSDYENLKKKYGERFAKFCRSNFSSLLEEEGLLSKIIESKFASNKTLFDDITKEDSQGDFVAYIYSFAPKEKIVKKQEKFQTPEELMKMAGYTLYKCETNDDVLGFKKYYKSDEELCTFRDPYRIQDYHIFFAVKDNVKEIKRENFKEPKRQDEYGTSVISLQFKKGTNCYLSIKNRYNHTVNNPDSTFSNNLENIIEGLTQSFEEHYGLKLQKETKSFDLDCYIKDSSGKFYKFNFEMDNVYYCPNNIIIKNGKAKKIDKNRYELVDHYLIDKQEKTINELCSHPDTNRDPFILMHDNIEKLEITKIDGKNRLFTLNLKDGQTVKITVDQNNRMVKYENNDITKIGNDFLNTNWYLEEFTARNLKSVGDNFIEDCDTIKKVNLPRLEKVGHCFLYHAEIEELNLPSLLKVGHYFNKCGRSLKKIHAPLLKSVGNSFLEQNNELTELQLPSLKTVGVDFLSDNEKLSELNLPVLKAVGSHFMYYNENLTNLSLPKLQVVSGEFLEKNTELEVLNLPSATILQTRAFLCNNNLKLINVPMLEEIYDEVLYANRELKVFYAPKLKKIGNNFLCHNEILTTFNAPNLTSIERGFLSRNLKLKEINTPKLENLDFDRFGRTSLEDNYHARHILAKIIKKNAKKKKKELEQEK